MRFRSLLLTLLILSLPATLPAQTIRFVKHNATGLNNGASWANAFTDLQVALNTAQPGDQVWVSAGTYFPTQPADGLSADMRHRSFVLPSGVSVYGGFAGNEPAGFDLSQRDFQNNITILSGDLEQNDDDSSGITTIPIGINSFHVVIAANITGAVLDGFTITGGVANGENAIDVHGESIADNHGGGLAINGAAITLSNIGLLGNSAYEGGGCRIAGATVTIHNGLIRKNFAVYGGGLTLYEAPTVLIEKTIIEDNTAVEGGGDIIALQLLPLSTMSLSVIILPGPVEEG